MYYECVRIRPIAKRVLGAQLEIRYAVSLPRVTLITTNMLKSK